MMKYTVDKNGLVSKIVRESSYVDVLLHVIELNSFEFMQWLESFVESCRAYGVTREQIDISVDMICKERAIMLGD